jgi:hypothetical protein
MPWQQENGPVHGQKSRWKGREKTAIPLLI